jgi:DNA-binding NarL/FixJ family response regulator
VSTRYARVGSVNRAAATTGIIRLLQGTAIDVVAQAADAVTLMHVVVEHEPDVAIVDIRMPPTHTDEGLAAADRIRDEHPDFAVLVLSQYLEPNYALRLLERHTQRVGYLHSRTGCSPPTF